MEKYLESSEYINWKSPEVLAKAKSLAEGMSSKEDIARQCFLFVRDDIKHSSDYQLNPVSCKASDVLQFETGYCYAKSHLLAALLRANNIPAGLCYQRLAVTADATAFCLHGLNAVFLEAYGWYRVDARGNKENLSAEFMPPVERLPFDLSAQGEADLPEIWSEPLPIITEILNRCETYQEVLDDLADVELL